MAAEAIQLAEKELATERSVTLGVGVEAFEAWHNRRGGNLRSALGHNRWGPGQKKHASGYDGASGAGTPRN